MPSFTRESGGTLHVAVMGVNRIGKVGSLGLLIHSTRFPAWKLGFRLLVELKEDYVLRDSESISDDRPMLFEAFVRVFPQPRLS